MTISDRVRVKNISVLSDRRYRLDEVEFDYRRGNGEWQTQKREVFDRGHAATLLPYNLANRTVVLARQFRLPPYLAGHDDLMIEAAAGMLDDTSRIITSCTRRGPSALMMSSTVDFFSCK